MSPATAESSPLQITFGPDRSGIFYAGLPVIAGETVENLFRTAQPAGKVGALTLFRMDDWLLGAATVRLTAGLEAAAHRLYLDIFQAAHRLHLARVWNYVPAINESGPGGLENYRLFCRGRSLAFEEHHGVGFKALLPSASAVGCGSGTITVSFAASATVPRHIENPLQVPAYDYPADYGPRAPSFARASVVSGGGKTATVFISGTAAIRGHATVAPNDLRGQMDCTMENLREISSACGLGPDLDRGGRAERHFKVYVRNAADQLAIATRLEREFLGSSDRVSYLQADICRETLLVEIEATLFGVNL
jgi:enamine deaminase RidA (YjgF/YER057c/UK114 family)